MALCRFLSVYLSSRPGAEAGTEVKARALVSAKTLVGIEV